MSDTNTLPKFKVVDELPPLRRGGARHNPLRDGIIEQLKTEDIVMVENVGDEKAYNSMQQRIRTAAASIDMAVTIRQQPNPKVEDHVDLYFQGATKVEEEAPAKTTAKK